jgi:F-type H+-transporting ATPase subunit delta
MAGAAARRHAQAAFQIALERDELDVWREDLGRLAEAVRDPGLRAFLESPRIHLDDKAGVLGRVLDKLNPVVMNMALLLISRGRLGLLPETVTEFGRLVDEHRGIAHAEVATAVPLDSKQEGKLAHRLSDIMGKDIVLTTEVEPSLIGGLTARVGDKLIDGSIKSRFYALRGSLIKR